MNCSGCKCIIDKKEAEKNEGLCDTCVSIKNGKRKISDDLMTSFGGKGKRGFVQWLKKGNFLQGMKDDADVVRHNDRIDVIEAMIGIEKFDKLYDKVADAVLELARGENA